jgi:hypothetical protein
LCLPEGITFTTQSEIDNFQINYPGCTEIEGDVTVSGEDISNLNGLAIISAIGGHLIIYENPILNSLTGLNNLTFIEEHFGIGRNDILINLMGLESLTTVGASMDIDDNESLVSLTGLEGLTSIGGSFSIDFNVNLASLMGLVNLTTIGGDLSISSNDILLNLTGLDNLTLIGGDLVIAYHYCLVSLTGLDNINEGTIENLYIHENLSLSTCEVQSICDYLASPNGYIYIHNNATGCENPPEIAMECGITLPCLPYGIYSFYNQADIDNFQINYPGCTRLSGGVSIQGGDISNLDGLDVVTSIEKGLVIEYNPVLDNLTGLSNLDSIGGLMIVGNTILASLSGLDSIEANSITELYIYDNESLSTCDITSICDYLADPNGIVSINNNAAGCSTISEVESACGVGLHEGNTLNNQISISPNPSSSFITIELSEYRHNNRVNIFNLEGQEIIRQPITGPRTVIDISNLSKGLYFVKLTSDRTLKVCKIVKE